MNSFLPNTLSDLETINSELHKCVSTDSVLKELRVYPCLPHPFMVLSIQSECVLSNWIGFNPSSHMTHGARTEEMLCLYRKICLDPFYRFRDQKLKYFDNEGCLRISVSKKIRIDNRELLNVVGFNLQRASAVANGSLPTLRDFCFVTECLPFYVSAIDNDDWLTDLSNLVVSSVGCTGDDYVLKLLAAHDERNLHPLSELKKKLYYARGQIRTYNVCREPAINVVGDILQKILQPKNKSLRNSLGLARYYPVYGKNILDLKIRVPAQHEYLTVAMGDLSAFTATCSGAWSQLLASYLHLHRTEPEMLDESLTIEIRGEYMVTSLREVLRYYLYRTALCKVNYEGQTAKILGGILGLKSNMTLTIMVLCFALAVSTRQYDSKTFRIQVGGDDFFIVAWGPKADDIVQSIRDSVHKYVGHLGDWHSYHYHKSDTATLPMRFCQKLVMFRGGNSIVEIRSEDKIPLMLEYLIKDEPLSDVDLRNFSVGILECIRKFSEENRAIASRLLPEVLLRVKSQFAPLEYRTHVLDVDTLNQCLQIDGMSVTAAAANYISETRPREYEGATFRTTFRTKFLYRQSRDESPLTVLRCGKAALTCLNREKSNIATVRTDYFYPICEFSEPFDHVANTFVQLVHAIRNMEALLSAELDRVSFVPEMLLVA